MSRESAIWIDKWKRETEIGNDRFAVAESDVVEFVEPGGYDICCSRHS